MALVHANPSTADWNMPMLSMTVLRPVRFTLVLLALLSVAGCYVVESPYGYGYERTDRGGDID